MRFFLTKLGPQKMVLGYPWFAAVQPKIDWAKGWIDYAQLPMVIKTPNSKAFLNRLMALPKRGQEAANLRRTTFQSKASKLAEQAMGKERAPLTIPLQYQKHAKVFSEQRAQRFPEPHIWDHAIDLKPGAPSTLPEKVYFLIGVHAVPVPHGPDSSVLRLPYPCCSQFFQRPGWTVDGTVSAHPRLSSYGHHGHRDS